MYLQTKFQKAGTLRTTDFKVVTENPSGVSFDGRTVKISKPAFNHLAVGEDEDVLMTYVLVDEYNAEIPKVILLNAKRCSHGITVTGSVANPIIDTESCVYVDLSGS